MIQEKKKHSFQKLIFPKLNIYSNSETWKNAGVQVRNIDWAKLTPVKKKKNLSREKKKNIQKSICLFLEI